MLKRIGLKSIISNKFADILFTWIGANGFGMTNSKQLTQKISYCYEVKGISGTTRRRISS